MNQTKRIVIIEGDAFDADAIVAITRLLNGNAFRVVLPTDTETSKYTATFVDAEARDAAMAVAILAWRGAVGDVPTMPPGYIPIGDTSPEEELEMLTRFWSDEKGRYYETYDGRTIYTGSKTGRFIWNEGPPRRKNPLGPEASPIEKVYVGEDGKPLANQPV